LLFWRLRLSKVLLFHSTETGMEVKFKRVDYKKKVKLKSSLKSFELKSRFKLKQSRLN
jgi:hypothetical protein